MVFFILAACLFLSCHKKEEVSYSPLYSDTLTVANPKKELVFAPHPLHNPVRLSEMFGPVIDILNKEIPEVHFTLEASKSYSDFNDKIKSQRLDIILPNPYQTTLAWNYDYFVFGKMGDDFNFKGIVLVRKESPIKTIADLKNKVVSFPAATALAGSMMPQYFMQKNGLNIKKGEIAAKYVGSQESSILALYHKEVDAAATWPMTWNSFSAEKTVLKDELRILFLTPALINNSLMAKKSVDHKILEKVKKIFFNLHQNHEGRVILSRMKLSKFEVAGDKQYKVVHQFLADYKNEFGVLPE